MVCSSVSKKKKNVGYESCQAEVEKTSVLLPMHQVIRVMHYGDDFSHTARLVQMPVHTLRPWDGPTNAFQKNEIGCYMLSVSS